MSDPVIFKTTAFGGFQKAAVLSYIDQLNTDNQKLKAELDVKVAALEAQVAQLKEQIPSEEEKAAAEEASKQQQQKSRELTELTDRLNLEIARQQKRLAEKEEEGRQRKFQFQAETNLFKAQKYDEVAMKVGTLVVDAKQQAERIVEQAREEAQAITREKEERLEKMNEDFLQFKQNVEQLRGELRETLELLDGKLEKLGVSPQPKQPLQPQVEKHTFAPFHLGQKFR